MTTSSLWWTLETRATIVMGVFFPAVGWVMLFFKKQLNVPNADILPGTKAKYPYVLVADEAFQLHQNLMKPYRREVLGIRERVFNYRFQEQGV